MDKRPNLNKELSAKDFEEFYWLKKELIQLCKTLGLKGSGGKNEIAERIHTYLKTGKKLMLETNPKPKSKFNWKKERLSLRTKITDNYKNTENSRAFFKQQIGTQFKFNVKFMNWIKKNTGKTLLDATKQWYVIKDEAHTKTTVKVIAPQFEYNRYLRDFMEDNPNAQRNLGIKLWSIKKSLRGNNLYSKDDLKLIKKTNNRIQTIRQK